VETYGRVDVLHNNVGIGGGDDEILSLSEAAWDKIMSVNLKGMFLSSRSVLPVMRQQRSGSIINISSIAAVRAYPSTSTAYTTSKAAVIGLTVSLAGQLGEGRVRVNCVAPGQVYTPLVAERLTEEGRRARASSGIIKEEGNAWDVAWASVFLASDESRWITGQTLFVDGGLSIALPAGTSPQSPRNSEQ